MDWQAGSSSDGWHDKLSSIQYQAFHIFKLTNFQIESRLTLLPGLRFTQQFIHLTIYNKDKKQR